MTIKKHDERLLKVQPYKKIEYHEYHNYINPTYNAPLDSLYLEPIFITWIRENDVTWKVITAQTLIALNREDTADNPARYDADKLHIPGSVIEGDDGYYSVDYSKLNFTPTAVSEIFINSPESIVNSY